MLWIVDLSLRRIGGTVPSTDPRVARKWLIVFRLVKAKFHYTDTDTDRTRTKSAHVVGYELNSTTRTRPDPHGPNGVSPQ